MDIATSLSTVTLQGDARNQSLKQRRKILDSTVTMRWSMPAQWPRCTGRNTMVMMEWSRYNGMQQWLQCDGQDTMVIIQRLRSQRKATRPTTATPAAGLQQLRQLAAALLDGICSVEPAG